MDPTGAEPASDRPQPPEAAAPVSCAHCRATAATPPLTWSLAVEDGTRHYLCDTCARTRLRGIEGRLDPAWW
ncbi:hypothetical protein POF50_013805 [Streptomyces sp. SL13]|uniref:Uncharacterized protein n=1 Tax=Streptantibioticus silvisoli TaxID=2705255 RepID=A0AA90H9F7_9ACTN|nr:hypothetical protein [Streptantibioticus silvisoli]MDI5970402.1 hypothetical protein [Streptantibioticus silvisoli]